MKKVCFCVPTIQRPHDKTLDAFEKTAKFLDAQKKYEHGLVSEIGNPYISNARNTLLRKALDWGAELIVFVDHDLSWEPEDMVKLLDAEGDCIAGLYRFTRGSPEDKHEYMGTIYSGEHETPLVRYDGAILAELVPAGFLKITREGINRFMGAYPDLLYGERCNPHVDLFNHGARDWLWYGEDYAMSRRFREGVGPIWVVPDVTLTHWRGEIGYAGNYHDYLMRQPGGKNACYLSAA